MKIIYIFGLKNIVKNRFWLGYGIHSDSILSLIWYFQSGRKRQQRDNQDGFSKIHMFNTEFTLQKYFKGPRRTQILEWNNKRRIDCLTVYYESPVMWYENNDKWLFLLIEWIFLNRNFQFVIRSCVNILRPALLYYWCLRCFLCRRPIFSEKIR